METPVLDFRSLNDVNIIFAFWLHTSFQDNDLPIG
jgi:hypothetical protein